MADENQTPVVDTTVPAPTAPEAPAQEPAKATKKKAPKAEAEDPRGTKIVRGGLTIFIKE